jgi:hypothetical protein
MLGWGHRAAARSVLERREHGGTLKRERMTMA